MPSATLRATIPPTAGHTTPRSAATAPAPVPAISASAPAHATAIALPRATRSTAPPHVPARACDKSESPSTLESVQPDRYAQLSPPCGAQTISARHEFLLPHGCDRNPAAFPT